MKYMGYFKAFETFFIGIGNLDRNRPRMMMTSLPLLRRKETKKPERTTKPKAVKIRKDFPETWLWADEKLK